MVKIVSQPEPKQINCRSCGCTLEYSYHDITEKRYDTGRDSGICYYISCPNCKETVGVERWKV